MLKQSKTTSAIADKATPGLAASNMTGTGPGGLTVREFAQWYRERELEQWQALNLAAIEKIAKALEAAEKHGRQVLGRPRQPRTSPATGRRRPSAKASG
jgi:hypothetical protein